MCLGDQHFNALIRSIGVTTSLSSVFVTGSERRLFLDSVVDRIADTGITVERLSLENAQLFGASMAMNSSLTSLFLWFRGVSAGVFVVRTVELRNDVIQIILVLLQLVPC